MPALRGRSIALTGYLEALIDALVPDATIITPAIPRIAHSLGVAAVDVNVAISAYLVTVAVLIPATTLLAPADLRDRVDRGDVGAVIARSDVADRFAEVPGSYLRIAVGDPVEGWLRYSDTAESLDPFSPDGPSARL